MTESSRRVSVPRIIDLGRIPYAAAYQIQLAHHEEVLAARESAAASSHPPSAISQSRRGDPHPPSADPGRILLVEHDPPVITISRRAGATKHLLATPAQLAAAGVELAETDRGGDITYHGPGQLVVYPILDLNAYRLGLHDYMRLLEQSVIDTLARFGIAGERDKCATGVWVKPRSGSAAAETVDSGHSIPPNAECRMPNAGSAKIAAMGVRIRRWVSLHGLALNITTNLDHFNLIVPCGLTGRAVTSMHRELGDRCPPMAEVKRHLAQSLTALLLARR